VIIDICIFFYRYEELVRINGILDDFFDTIRTQIKEVFNLQPNKNLNEEGFEDEGHQPHGQ